MEDASFFAAFISYRHTIRDQQWARSLFSALEAYQVPADLTRRGYPSRLGRLFRDEDEIPASADLSDQIRQALARSAALIVICSPDTPKSRWIRREITLFQEMGKGDRAIPVLIDGTPDESFPSELLRRKVSVATPDGAIDRWEEVEPIAVDLRRSSEYPPRVAFERGVIRLAAALLGVPFDDLYRRDLRQRRARMWSYALTGIAVLGAVSLAGVGYWHIRLRLVTQYCAAYAERFLVPECVGEMTREEVEQTDFAYRIVSRAGMPREMTLINGKLSPVDDDGIPYGDEPWRQGAARSVYRYADDGVLADVEQSTATGRLVRRTSYDFETDRVSGVARFDRDIGVAVSQTASSSALGPLSERDGGARSAIGQHRLRFDSGGRLVERIFEPLGGGAKAGDALGSFGRAYSYDARGLVVSLRNIDGVGDTLIDKQGVAVFGFSFDPSGRLSANTWLDKADRPIENDRNFAAVQYQRDEHGRVIEVGYRDRAGSPALPSDSGIAGMRYRYDERGNIVSKLHLGPTGEPMPLAGHGAVRIDYVVDAQGRVVRESYFDSAGSPKLRQGRAYAAETRQYDGRGNVTAGAYFDAEGRPTLRRDGGHASWTQSYDERGNPVAGAYYDRDGAPILNSDTGIAYWTQAFDGQDNLVGENNYGVDGQLRLRKDTGAASLLRSFDPRGNVTEISYYGTGREPILLKDVGYSSARYEYDSRGNNIGVRYFGTDGLPVLSGDTGVARWEVKFDSRGNAVGQAWFGLDDQPIARKDAGVASLVMRRDEHSRIVAIRMMGPDGTPAIYKPGGFATVEWEYDAAGNTSEERYFGADGASIAHIDLGVARVRWEYNARGEALSEAYSGADGKPQPSRQTGIVRREFERDEYDRLTEIRHFDANHRSALSKDSGAATIRFRYDARGNLISTTYFDAAGAPTLNIEDAVHEIRSTLDVDGRVVLRENLGTDGAPIRDRTGTAAYGFTYDARGNVETRTYYDQIDGSPRRNKNATGYRFTYDERDNQILQTRLDEQDRPAQTGASPVVSVATAYDAADRVTRKATLDAGGMPVVDPVTRFATETLEYDQRGEIIRTRWFDASDAPTMRNWGMASMDNWYDQRGNMVGQTYRDERGAPMLMGYFKIAGMRWKFDGQGRIVEESLVDTADKPMAGPLDGYARVELAYDARGDNVRQTYYDAEGRLAANTVGFARAEFRYDMAARLVEARFFGADGAPVERRARLIDRFDRILKLEPLTNIFGDGDLAKLVVAGALSPDAVATVPQGGFARLVQAFDSRNNIVRRSYFDRGGRPTSGLSGFVEELIEYDAQDRPILLKPIVGDATTVALPQIWTRLAYDGKGRIVRIDYVTSSGDIINGRRGFATIVFQRAADGSIVQWRFYDASGNEIGSRQAPVVAPE